MSESAILGLDLSLLYTNFLSPARVSHTCVLLLGNLYDQVRIVSLERQLLDEGDKLEKLGGSPPRHVVSYIERRAFAICFGYRQEASQ